MRGRKSKRIHKVCQFCGCDFDIPEYEHKRRDRKYCGLECYYAEQRSHVNEKFFAEPNSIMAYVLGLFFTDGCISIRDKNENREYASLKSIDKDLLELVAKLMSYEYNIYFAGKSEADNDTWRIDISNKHIIEDLKKWGMERRKTLTLKFPDLPEDCHIHFVRGVFDGDGCVAWWNNKIVGNVGVEFSLLGTNDLLTPIPKLLDVECKVKPYRSISKMRCWKHYDLVRIYNLLYPQADVPCLHRKKKKFEEVLEKIDYGRRSAEIKKQRKLLEQQKQEATAC